MLPIVKRLSKVTPTFLYLNFDYIAIAGKNRFHLFNSAGDIRLDRILLSNNNLCVFICISIFQLNIHSLIDGVIIEGGLVSYL